MDNTRGICDQEKYVSMSLEHYLNPVPMQGYSGITTCKFTNWLQLLVPTPCRDILEYHINKMWRSNGMWRHRFESTLAQIMVCCPTTDTKLLPETISTYHQKDSVIFIWGQFQTDPSATNHLNSLEKHLWYCVPFKGVNMSRAMWRCRLSGWWYGWLCAIRTWWRHQIETFHKKGIIVYVNCSLILYK